MHEDTHNWRQTLPAECACLGRAAPQEGRARGNRASLTCQDQYDGCGICYERTSDKYHSRRAFLFDDTLHIRWSFLARRGENVDSTGVSETQEGREVGTLDHTDFACTKVTLVNFSPQNIQG